MFVTLADIEMIITRIHIRLSLRLLFHVEFWTLDLQYKTSNHETVTGEDRKLRYLGRSKCNFVFLTHGMQFSLLSHIVIQLICMPIR